MHDTQIKMFLSIFLAEQTKKEYTERPGLVVMDPGIGYLDRLCSDQLVNLQPGDTCCPLSGLMLAWSMDGMGLQ